MPTLTPTNILPEAGLLMIAPLGSTLPTMAAAGGTYAADAWPAAWYNPGPTKGGTKLDINITTSDLEVAELYTPVDVRTTKRTGTITFELANYTAKNLAQALNGGISSTVSGTGATLSTKVALPGIGSEVGCMIGWESVDSTVRFIAYICKNTGNVSTQFAKSPNYAGLTWQANLIKPSGTDMVEWYFAGTTRS